MDARAFFVVLAAIALPAYGQQVYKCVAGKAVTYQSTPCASGAAVKAWDATPVPEPSNAELWRRYRLQRELDRRYAAQHSGGGYGASVSGSQSGGACETAKRQREAVYAAAGLHRSFELSSQMDNAVHDACK